MSNQDKLKELARMFIKRATAQEMKGKARDRAALDFFLGAWAHAEISGDKSFADHLSAVATFGLQFRGYKEVEHIAKGCE